MIKVTITLFPGGDAAKAKPLQEIYITRVGQSKNLTRGAYHYTIFTAGRVKRLWKQGWLEDFPRKTLNATDLLYWVLKHALGKRSKGQNDDNSWD